ncbi:AbrB family transcriptional regulator [Streptomyces lydicus]|uniref:AbrB family transcriptional regulator n=1 Tax=Streptomyces lydicus TaxID=47763 RepID=UPI0037901614
MLSVARWLAVVAVCYLLGSAADAMDVPAAHLLLSLFAGAAAALCGLVRQPFPKQANRVSQAVVGVLMGSYLSPHAVFSMAGSLVPVIAVTLLTIALCAAAALALPRIARMSRADAVLGLVPGGSAAIISCAEEMDADSRVVAFMQYFRVALVAGTAPAVVLALGASTSGSTPPGVSLTESFQLVDSTHPVAGVTVLIALCILGNRAGRRLGLPAPALLGPMLLTGVGVFTGAAHGFTPVGVLEDVAFTMVGLEVGLRFTPTSVRHVGRLLPVVVGATTALCAACAVLAAALAAVIHVPFLDAYLATTPGGINAVLATASSSHSDVVLISTAQGLRLFAVVLLAPPLIRRLTGPALRRTFDHGLASGADVPDAPSNRQKEKVSVHA